MLFIFFKVIQGRWFCHQSKARATWSQSTNLTDRRADG